MDKLRFAPVQAAIIKETWSNVLWGRRRWRKRRKRRGLKAESEWADIIQQYITLLSLHPHLVLTLLHYWIAGRQAGHITNHTNIPRLRYQNAKWPAGNDELIEAKQMQIFRQKNRLASREDLMVKQWLLIRVISLLPIVRPLHSTRSEIVITCFTWPPTKTKGNQEVLSH